VNRNRTAGDGLRPKQKKERLLLLVLDHEDEEEDEDDQKMRAPCSDFFGPVV